MKILICDKTEKEYIEQMRAAGLTVDVRDDISLEDLAAVIGEYEAIVVRSRTKVKADLIDHSTKLKLIVRGGVGVDTIDVAHAESRGIVVRNTPAASSNAVAELALGMMFAAPLVVVCLQTAIWLRSTGTLTAAPPGSGRISRRSGRRWRAGPRAG